MNSNLKGKKKGKLGKISNMLVRYVALKVYTRYGNIPGMYRNLQKLKPIYKNKPHYYMRLSKLAYQQKMWDQSLEYIDIAIQLTKDSSATELYLSKANSLIHLGESSKAITCLNTYLSVSPNDAQAWHLLANEQRKICQWEDAIASFKTCLELNPTDSTSIYQLAECYRHLKDYQNGETYYKQAINKLSQRANHQALVTSYYWLGCIQLTNDPAQATMSFNKVIQLDKALNSQRFGIGVFHEHYKQWERAVEAYTFQLSQNDNDAELHFKLATLLDKTLHAPKLALKHYVSALYIDKVRSPWHFSLANCYEQLKDYQNAAKWFESAIARQEKHRPGNYRRLASVLVQLGRTEDALTAYKEAELFSKSGMMSEKFYKNHITKATVRYAISYEHYPVNDQMIFYESLSGTRMMDSPFAIFEYVLNKKDFKNFIHVWVVNSFEVIPDTFRSMDNIIFVKRKSDAYFKHICSAKYLICNSTFDPYVARKPNQLYLQTSHGIFYKTVGRDSVGTSIGVAGSTRNLLQATHIIVPNEYMAEKQPKSYSIQGIHSGKIAKIGYPRIDVTYNMTDQSKRQIASRLGIELSKEIVLYVPTWRGTKSDNHFDSTQLVHDLKKLAELNVNVVFRGHPISNRLLKSVTIPENIIIPPPDILTNELLGIANIVISDYSSVFFDFLVTERPIIHYLYDLDEYKKERGLNLNEDELPGTVVKTSEQLVRAVKNNLQNDEPNPHYLAAKERFCPYDDGKSTERVVKWFFYDDRHNIHFVKHANPEQSYLYFIGKMREEKRFSKLVDDLTNSQQNSDIVSLLFSNDVSRDKNKKGMVSKLHSDVNLIVHDKNMPVTLEEAFAMYYFETNGKFISESMETSYKKAYMREARRLFGDSQFDQVINYETDSPHYKALQEMMLIEKT